MRLILEGRRKRDLRQRERMGWLQWVIWSSVSTETLKLEDFLPGTQESGKVIDAKKDPEAFAAELARQMKIAERRAKRKAKRVNDAKK